MVRRFPFTNDERPYWADSVLQDHVQPAAKAVGITKTVGWHTFRHSLATLHGKRRQDAKTIQELMRHASSRITVDVYQQGDTETKRTELSSMSSIFVVQKVKADKGAIVPLCRSQN